MPTFNNHSMKISYNYFKSGSLASSYTWTCSRVEVMAKGTSHMQLIVLTKSKKCIKIVLQITIINCGQNVKQNKTKNTTKNNKNPNY